MFTANKRTATRGDRFCVVDLIKYACHTYTHKGDVALYDSLQVGIIHISSMPEYSSYYTLIILIVVGYCVTDVGQQA